ncbi:MAG: Wzz/FepE/Etk N-terminal domain-containing protein [Bacteroidales bacterium]|nr:Wzz/FepE/Etk N-terminal domain-containing protein [Bacteroidales bacterium]
MDKYFDNTSLVKVISKWKKHIIIITVAAAIIGAVFSSSYFITPMYKSEALLYPDNIWAFSDETFTEQMLQVIQSQDIIDSVINDFNLDEHYEIDKDYKYYKTALYNEYRTNVSISRTPYDAVKISVKDKDPEIACAMVNDIIRLYDLKVRSLQKLKHLEYVDQFKAEIANYDRYIDSLKDRLNEIASNYGIISVPEQTKEITRAIANGNSSRVAELKENLETYGPEVIDINDKLLAESEVYSEVREEYEQYIRKYQANLTHSNIISSPYPSDKKSYPVRWIIVVLCALSACILSTLVIYAIEHNRTSSK